MAGEVERAIEAIVMVAEEPIPLHLLAQILEVPPARVEELCQALAEAYAAEDRGFQLVRVAGGYRFQSHPDLAGYVERFALEGQASRLSAAALETLALVAYKQPVSRAQVAEVRGVSVDGVMRTLQHRGYVAEVARDPGPGQAVLYGTTARFLEKLGIDSLEQLPPLAQFVPGPEVMEALDAGLRHGGKASPETAAADEDDNEAPGMEAAWEVGSGADVEGGAPGAEPAWEAGDEPEIVGEEPAYEAGDEPEIAGEAPGAEPAWAAGDEPEIVGEEPAYEAGDEPEIAGEAPGAEPAYEAGEGADEDSVAAAGPEGADTEIAEGAVAGESAHGVEEGSAPVGEPAP